MSEIHNPKHYGGANNPYETIKVIEAWSLNFCLGNVVKYISRAGKKYATGTGLQGHKSVLEHHIQDLEKAKWYLEHEINKLKQLKDE